MTRTIQWIHKLDSLERENALKINCDLNELLSRKAETLEGILN